MSAEVYCMRQNQACFVLQIIYILEQNNKLLRLSSVVWSMHMNERIDRGTKYSINNYIEHPLYEHSSHVLKAIII